MDIKERILVALGLDKSEDEIKLAFQAKGEDGTIFVSTAEELESGVDISVLTEDGTTIPLPIGTYKLDTGVTFRVEEEGVVAEVIESETEEEDTKEDEKEEMNEETELKKKDKEDEDEDEDEEEMKKKKEYESEAEETDWAKTYEEMKEIFLLEKFELVNHWGTFASQKDIEPVLYETGPNDLTIAYQYLKDYYDSNLLSVLFAPLYPRYSRNCLWHLRKI